ncbi:hypothetical protein TW85_21970 [Marinomonas sp. S3726]|uniref:hypothetical protein n=1 Tax=Marinomonas sp. S3726 TaxID=579484 RepID=UPI0005FA39AD|nr:hypothetical protein [Marinomonas sp. S3726]KJZ09486.1 hypothetical protein TW85_21970 [Marinomonas sp. S3726]
MGNIKGKLTNGILFEGKKQTDYEMREVETAGELFDAEIESGGVENQLAFNGALIARQLVRVGDFTGPFGIEHIRKLSPQDFTELRKAQGKLSKASSESETEETV